MLTGYPTVFFPPLTMKKLRLVFSKKTGKDEKLVQNQKDDTKNGKNRKEKEFDIVLTCTERGARFL